ncbi:MAG: hypothetical protein ABWY27_02490 [Telluria sp.]
MLDFSLESTTDYAAADSTVQRGPTARAPADRRTSSTPKEPATSSSLKRQRRRHDNLNMGKQTPLE